MRLKHLTITNCSRVSDLDIDVRGNLVLIGPTGSGKTTVLLALDMLLGMSGQQLYGTLTPNFIRDASQPMAIEAVFTNLSAEELAVFPHEVDAASGYDLPIKLEASFDGSEIAITKSFPGSMVQKGPSKAQEEAFGWKVLRTQAGLNDVREGRKPDAGDAVPEINLASDKAHASETMNQMEEILSTSESLDAVRQDISSQLSQALPFDLGKGDVEFVPEATMSGDLMSNVQLKTRKNGQMRPMSEHSDGMRSLFAMAIYELLHKGTNVLAIDEPEAHLHPSSQRSLAKKLKTSGCQKVLVTHSPTIAGSFEPDEIVVIRPDGRAVQPRRGFLEGNVGMLARWWIGKQLEPLTAGSVIAVEGPSDRIIVDKVASALGFDLDQHDIVVVETSGCGDMKVIESIFGSGGFGIPLYELIDEDAADDAARRLGVDETDLGTRNVFVSTRDLEDEYVQAIGARRLWDKLKAAKTFSPGSLAHCATGLDGYPTETALAQFIREKSKRKIPAALVAASLIDNTNAQDVRSIARLLGAMLATEPAQPNEPG